MFNIFFFNDTPTTEIYTLSLHDALPICGSLKRQLHGFRKRRLYRLRALQGRSGGIDRSEEHTSELQSQFHLVCRLLLEKKKKKIENYRILSNITKSLTLNMLFHND